MDWFGFCAYRLRLVTLPSWLVWHVIWCPGFKWLFSLKKDTVRFTSILVQLWGFYWEEEEYGAQKLHGSLYASRHLSKPANLAISLTKIGSFTLFHPTIQIGCISNRESVLVHYVHVTHPSAALLVWFSNSHGIDVNGLNLSSVVSQDWERHPRLPTGL